MINRIVSIFIFIITVVSCQKDSPISGKWIDKKLQAKKYLRNFETALLIYKAEHNKYPTQQEGLSILVKKKYLTEIPKDPWGNDYHYYSPPRFNKEYKYELVCFGADGKPGGFYKNADIIIKNK